MIQVTDIDGHSLAVPFENISYFRKGKPINVTFTYGEDPNTTIHLVNGESLYVRDDFDDLILAYNNLTEEL